MVLKMLYGKYRDDAVGLENAYDNMSRAVSNIDDYVCSVANGCMGTDATEEAFDADMRVSNLLTEISNSASDDDFDRFCKFVTELDDTKFDLLYAAESCEDAADNLQGYGESGDGEVDALRRMNKILVDMYDNVTDYLCLCKLEIDGRQLYQEE